jgi:hypothetical protein
MPHAPSPPPAPEILNRKPKDFDWICTRQDYEDFLKKNDSLIEPTEIYSINESKIIVKGKNNLICEFNFAENGNTNEEFCDLVLNDKNTLKTELGLIPSLDLLFTLKKSHRYLKNSPHFFKNFFDYHRMKSIGANSFSFSDFLKRREKETYANIKLPKLIGVKTKDFFDGDQVNYVYNHDDIHVSIALMEKPAYCYYLKPGCEVECSKDMFFSQPEHIRNLGVFEESAVLSIERSLVPFPNKLSVKDAWLLAFSKCVTTITGGWFREWGYENGPKILNLFSVDSEQYWSRFNLALSKNEIRLFNGDKNPYK